MTVEDKSSSSSSKEDIHNTTSQDYIGTPKSGRNTVKEDLYTPHCSVSDLNYAKPANIGKEACSDTLHDSLAKLEKTLSKKDSSGTENTFTEHSSSTLAMTESVDPENEDNGSSKVDNIQEHQDQAPSTNSHRSEPSQVESEGARDEEFSDSDNSTTEACLNVSDLAYNENKWSISSGLSNMGVMCGREKVRLFDIVSVWVYVGSLYWIGVVYPSTAC